VSAVVGKTDWKDRSADERLAPGGYTAIRMFESVIVRNEGLDRWADDGGSNESAFDQAHNDDARSTIVFVEQDRTSLWRPVSRVECHLRGILY